MRSNSLVDRIVSVSVSLSLLCVSTVPSFAAPTVADIPDEIDFQKYLGLYQTSKRVSDSKRERTNQLLVVAQDLETRKRNTETQLATTRQNLQRMVDLRSRLQLDTPALIAQNQALTEEISRLNNDLNANNAILADLNRQYRQVIDQIPGMENAIRTRRIEVQRAQQELDATASRLVAAEREMQLAQESLDHAINEHRNKQERLRDTDEQLNALQRQAQFLPGRISQLQQQQGALDARVIQAQQALDATQSRIQPLLTRLNGSRMALQAAQTRYNSSQAAYDQINAKVTQNEQQIAATQGKIGGINLTITDKKAELTRNQGSLASANAELTRQYGLRDQADAEIAQLTAEIEALRVKIAELKASIETKTARVRQLIFKPNRTPEETAEFNRLNREIPQDEQELKQAQNRRENRNTDLDKAKNRRSDVVNKIAQIQSSINSLTARIAAIPGEITALEGQIPPLQATLANLQRTKQELAGQHRTAQTELTESTTFLNVARKENQDAQREYDAAQAQIAPLQQQLRDATANRDRNREELAQNQRQLTEVQEKLPRVQAVRNALAAEVQELARQIPFRRGVLDQQRQRYSDVRFRYDTLAQNRDSLAQDLALREQALRTAQGQANDLDNRIRQLNDQNSRTLASIEQRRVQMNRNAEVIAANQRSLIDLERQIPLAENDVTRQEGLLAQLVYQVDQAYAGWRSSDADASVAERQTQDLYAQYTARKSTYDSRMIAARDAGQRQGTQEGFNAGSRVGADEGARAGRERGTAQGKEDGLADGLRRGKAEGDARGYQDGYDRARNAPENYQPSYNEGLRLGEIDAYAYARQTEYPRGAQAKRAELRATPPSSLIRIDNRSVDAQGIRVSSAAELKRGLGEEFAITFNEFEGKKLTRQTSVEPKYSFFASAAVNVRTAADCRQGYIDFDRACEDAYKAAYTASYNQGYSQARQRAESEAFESARIVAFNAHKDVRYREGYDQALPGGVARGLTEGALEAGRRGLADGRAAGYANHLEVAKASEFTRGANDMAKQISENAEIGVLDARMVQISQPGETTSEIVAGDTLQLVTTFANYGGKASVRGQVKVQLEAVTGNIAVDGGVAEVIGLAAGTRSEVSFLAQARVLNSATFAQTARLKATFTLADGSIDVRMIDVAIAPHVLVAVTNNTDTTPVVNRKEELRVDITNISAQDALVDLQVVLTSDASPFELRIDKGEVRQKKLKAGQKERAPALNFTVLNQAALDRGIKLYVTVFHGNNIASRSEIFLTRNR